MTGLKTVLATAILTMGFAGVALAQGPESPNESWGGSVGTRRQVDVDTGVLRVDGEKSARPAAANTMSGKKMSKAKKATSRKTKKKGS
jgi:hypothetical protein